MHDVRVDIRTLAWCLMANHFRVVAVPEAKGSHAALLRRDHGRCAQMLNVQLKRTCRLFSNLFFRCPQGRHTCGGR